MLGGQVSPYSLWPTRQVSKSHRGLTCLPRMTAVRKGILKGSCVGMFKTPKLLPTGIRLPVTNKGNSTMRKARG